MDTVTEEGNADMMELETPKTTGKLIDEVIVLDEESPSGRYKYI